MFIRERMTRNPVLCSAALPISDAFDLMKKNTSVAYRWSIKAVSLSNRLRKGCAARPAFARHGFERL